MSVNKEQRNAQTNGSIKQCAVCTTYDMLITCNAPVYFCVVASLGLGADSAIAVLQVIIASLTVYLVTVTKVVSHLVCATQTQGGVSAR